MKLSDIKPCTICGSEHFEIEMIPNWDGEIHLVIIHCIGCFKVCMGRDKDRDKALELAIIERNKRGK